MQKASAKAEPERRSLGEGAAQAAPTAPHATPRAAHRPFNGPELFWGHRRLRVALALCVVASVVTHGAILPIDGPHRFELNDIEGEAVIPIDVLVTDETPPPTAPTNSQSSAPNDEKSPSPVPAASVGASLHGDAGGGDAGRVRDAAVDSPVDAEQDSSDDRPPTPRGQGPTSTDGQAPLDGAIVIAHADGGSGATRDPEAIIGAESVRADVPLVLLVVNAEVIRSHPVGARMGYLLRGIPQWNEFMSGTDLDPVRDTDWVMISGPSLINTAHDSVLVHYSASDAVVDRAVRIVSSKYDLGGPVDAGVRGLKATLIHADRAERVIMRPQPHLLAIVPPNVVQKNARALAGGAINPHIHPGEAVYMRLANPHRPVPEVPESITEMRMRVVPRTDGGADVFVDGDTKDADTASQAAEGLRRMVRRHNDTITSIFTHGLLDGVDVKTSDSTVKVHLSATLDQIQTLVVLVGGFLGVEPEAPAGSASSSARPRTPSKPWRSE